MYAAGECLGPAWVILAVWPFGYGPSYDKEPGKGFTICHMHRDHLASCLALLRRVFKPFTSEIYYSYLLREYQPTDIHLPVPHWCYPKNILVNNHLSAFGKKKTIQMFVWC